MRWLVISLTLSLSVPAAAQSFVNYESAHVHPLELTPDGTKLVAVNTPDNRIEVFDATGSTLVRLFDVQTGLDPVSVRARTSDEVWVVNKVSDSVSVVRLSTARVVATFDTDDEPCDVIFAGSPQRAFVSCGQPSKIQVFDPTTLALINTLSIVGEEPRALAVDATGMTVYCAIFESGNGSTVLGGANAGNIGFPPNVAQDPAGPWGGVSPPPNSGPNFDPPKNPSTPIAPKVSQIVKKNAAGAWMDDNGGDWTSLVSGPQAALSGRPVGWDLADHDVAILDANTLSISYVRRLMNICMAIGVNPANGEITVVGTDGTNEIRFEPIVKGKFLRVELARVSSGGTVQGVVDLNPHLDYTTSTVTQSERDKSLGDPRGIVWNASGTRGYVTGMGSNNLVVVDALGGRAGPAPTIEVGRGPTGVVIDEARGRLYVLARFDSSVSLVSLASESEIGRVPFYTPEPSAITVGRQHLYDTHSTSGLGQIACASCHVDSRFDRLGWDLGDPAGTQKTVAGQNLGAGIPGLNTGFVAWHPMKGPMTTQTLQDIIGKEPLHWRGDRAGLEEFNPAFVGLQGDDVQLTAAEMQEYENFLVTITYPPNPYRNFDNTLPTNLPLPGHHTPGRFAPAGLPLPNGNAQNGLAIYMPPRLLDNGALACITCHTLPTGMGTDYKLQGNQFVPVAPGPNGERHHMLVSVDGTTSISTKVPQLRNLYFKTGFDLTQLVNTAGFGVLHDGSVDSIERFIAEPVFTVASDQEIADLTAFMLALSGSDLPTGSSTNILMPPGSASRDSHAAVGAQTTLVDAANPGIGQLALIAQMLTLADNGKVGVVVKGRIGGLARGYAYLPGLSTFQADRSVEALASSALQALAAPGSELTYTVVPTASATRIGIDRDLDGFFDRDELDQGSDPADPTSTPGGCAQFTPNSPRSLIGVALSGTQVNLTWVDASSNEDGFVIERAPAGSGAFASIGSVGAGVQNFPDAGAACETAYDYRVSAFNCAGNSGFSQTIATSGMCCTAPSVYCTAKVNSQGCTPAIAFSGAPSFSVAQPFLITASNVINQKNGLFFYGKQPLLAPFQGGFLCATAPVTRVNVQNSGGSASGSDCTGTFSFDFNAWMQGGNDPGLAQGVDIYSQYWYRDPADPHGFGTGLTDALQFEVCP